MTWQLTEAVHRYTGKLLALTLGMALLGLIAFIYVWRGGQDAKLLGAMCEALAFALYFATTVSLLRVRKQVAGSRTQHDPPTDSGE